MVGMPDVAIFMRMPYTIVLIEKRNRNMMIMKVRTIQERNSV
jgi:hypothetical protein